MPTSLCSEVFVKESTTPEEGGLIKWIKDHPIESLFAIISTGAFSYVIYDTYKNKKYPTKSKKASKR